MVKKKREKKKSFPLVRAAWIGSSAFRCIGMVRVIFIYIWITSDEREDGTEYGNVRNSLGGAAIFGGFWGADIESDYFRELIVALVPIRCFLPGKHGCMVPRKRTANSNRTASRHKRAKRGDNEIWKFWWKGIYSILKELVELRERLRPYIHKYMDIASWKRVRLVMRPMFFNYPEDEVCYNLGDQYIFWRGDFVCSNCLSGTDRS